MTGQAEQRLGDGAAPRVLAGSERPLTDAYDVALLDLDGVVYVDSSPVPGVSDALVLVRRRGMRLAFVTNNASRRAAEVAGWLRGMGIPASPDEVVTSAQAAARVLGEQLSGGARVLVVGAVGLAEEIRSHGLVPVWSADDRPEAVVQGWSADVGWRQLAEAALALRRGAVWIATNADSTLPSARGLLPGNGAMIAPLRVATGRSPTVVGKPMPQLHRECIARTGATRPLVVGDRLDTDIAGATAAGVDSLLVLSGVTDPATLLGAADGERPSYLADDLSGILRPQPEVTFDDRGAVCGGFAARHSGAAIELVGGGGDRVDALRALCAAAWSSNVGSVDAGAVVAEGEPAAAALASLGLAGRTR